MGTSNILGKLKIASLEARHLDYGQTCDKKLYGSVQSVMYWFEWRLVVLRGDGNSESRGRVYIIRTDVRQNLQWKII